MESMLRELVVRIKEQIEDRNTLSLDSIGEEDIIEGLIDLFKNTQTNNIVEYFRKYRKIERIIECPVSSLLLEEKQTKHRIPIQTGYRRAFKTKGHFSKVLCMMFDRSETFIFTGGEDGIIKIWDVYSGRAVNSLIGHLSPIFDFVIDYDNRYFISCDQTGTIIAWDLQTYERVNSVSIGEQIDYLDTLYEEEEAEPLEQKRSKKTERKRKTGITRVIVVTNSGRILKISVSKTIEIETVLKEIEDETFNGAVTTRGKKMVVVTGMWPFAILLDVADIENRFYVLNTEDMISSSVDISHNSLKFAISTYSSVLMVWEYEIGQKPSKGNISTRKKYKGRDLEGCWKKTTIDLQGMSESVYNTDIIYLIDDITIVSVDTESNIRIINTQTKDVKIIEKDYKITGIISHPTKNVFLTVEVNGIIKVFDRTGTVIEMIRTDVSVAGTIVIDSTGSFFYIADLEGAVYKYSIGAEAVEPPETEYLLKDFDHYFSYNTEQIRIIQRVESEGQIDTEGLMRVYEERNSIINQIKDKITEKTDKNTYTVEGKSIGSGILNMPFPLYNQSVDKWIRNIEVSSILQLQSEMITGKVFEKEYMRESQNIVALETEEETISENNEDSSSNWQEDRSDNSFGTDTESPDESEDMHSEKESYSTKEESTESEIYSVNSTENEIDTESEIEEPDKNTSRILSRKRGRRQAARKALCPDIPEVYGWYMSDKPVHPILPQVNDTLILVRDRITSRNLKNKIKENETEIKVLDIEYLATEIRVKFAVEKEKEEYIIVYDAAQAKTNPFLLKKQQEDLRKKRYVKNEEIYFYQKDVLRKGIVIQRKESEIKVESDNSTLTIHIRDVYSSLSNYSADLSQYLNIILKYKEEYPIFYKEVSKIAYPDYYEIVSKPMPINKIIRRLKNKYYRTKEELICDINTVYTNCCEYNEEDSEISAECKILTENILSDISK